MQNKRFATRQSSLLSEQSMFTTVPVDSDGKCIDLFIKLKRFRTLTDGQFTLVVMAEVDPILKMVTGRYIIFKLGKHVDEAQEASKREQQERA